MSLAASARDELERWQPPTPSQALLRDDFVAHLSTHDDGCERGCRPDHLTASALVVDGAGSRVLLCLHRKVGLWLQFGGHIEAGDISVADAALREAKEESGIEALTLIGSEPVRLDRHAAPCDADARYHLDVQYLAMAPGGAEPSVSSESLDVRWFDPDALPEQTDEAVRQLVADALALTSSTRRP
jgi:8-oxo-dGTP pyrophosphatase MutT (NUDIX family)